MKLALTAVSVGAAAVALGSFFCLAADPPVGGKKKLLFYSQSFGFRHSVVTRPLTGELSHAERILKEIGEKAGYEVLLTQDFNDLRDEGRLKQFDAIVIYTTGNPLINRDAFLKWLREGGAVVGIHTATDSFQSDHNYAPGWPEYVRIMGGAFKTHGGQDPVVMKVHDPDHPAVAMIEDGWKISDEIYQFARFNENVHLLLSIDTEKMDDKALAGQKMKKGEFYPVAWTHTEGKGRVFYTSLGHREDVWTNPTYQQHLMAGLAWALGQK